MLALCVAGCSDHEPVRTYSVEKEPGPVVRQIDAGVVFANGEAWFVKLEGEPEQVGPLREGLLVFLSSLKFAEVDAESKELAYTLPEGWKFELSPPSPGGSIGSELYAVVEVDGRPQPRLTISRFETSFPETASEQQQAEQEYLLQNVNRWRRQVALLPYDGKGIGLAGESFTTESGQRGMLFSMVGQAEPEGRQPPAPREFEFDSESYDLPAGWKLIDNDQFSTARFSAGKDGAVVVSVTPVISNEAPMDTFISNVSRWANQLGMQLDPTTLQENTAPREVDGHTAILVNLVSQTPQPIEGISNAGPVSIVGVLTFAEGSIIAIRMKGPAELVQAEVEPFNKFLDSVKLKSKPRQ